MEICASMLDALNECVQVGMMKLISKELQYESLSLKRKFNPETF